MLRVQDVCRWSGRQENGTFVSVLDQFQPSATQTHYPDLGMPLTLKCTPPRSYPPAEIFWATFTRLERLTPIDLTDRISIDPDGEGSRAWSCGGGGGASRVLDLIHLPQCASPKIFLCQIIQRQSLSEVVPMT